MTQTRLALERGGGAGSGYLPSPLVLGIRCARAGADVGLGGGASRLALGADLSAGKGHHNTYKWCTGAGHVPPTARL
eukprot:44105-Rhodomonas_salina.1